MPSFKERTLSFMRLFLSPEFGTFVFLALVFFVALAERLEPLNYLSYTTPSGKTTSFPISFPYAIATLDPFQHYRVAERLIDYGFQAFYSSLYPGLSSSYWNDTMAWFPGRDVTANYMVGIAYVSVVAYWIAHFFDLYVTVGQVIVYLPALLGALTVVMLYFFGKELYGRRVGLIAAAIGLITPAFMTRSMAGHIDGEPIDLFLWVIALTLFVKAYKEKKPGLSLIAGLIIGFSGSVWGGYLYVSNSLALFAIALVLLERVDSQKARVLIAVLVPSTAVPALLLPEGALWLRTLSAWMLPGLAAFLLVIYSTWAGKNAHRLHLISVSTLAVLAVSVSFLFVAPLVPSLSHLFPSGRLATVVNPFATSGIESTVGEQEMSTWTAFYGDYLFLLPFVVASLYFLIERRYDVDILLALMIFVGIYGEAAMVRLDQILAIPASIGAAFVLEKLFSGIGKSFAEKKGIGAGLLLILVVLAGAYYSAPSAYRTAAGVPMIDSGLGGPTDTSWLQALEWIKTNTPRNAVVASWWDYGYWLTTVGDRATLSDGATISTARIRLIAQAFMSNQTKAYDILYGLGAQYVVATDVFGYFYASGSSGGVLGPGTSLPEPPIGIAGDIGKSTAMMTILGYNQTRMSHYLDLAGTPVDIGIPYGQNITWPFMIPLSRGGYAQSASQETVTALVNGSFVLFIRNDTTYNATITNAKGIAEAASKLNETSELASQFLSANPDYDGLYWTVPRPVTSYNTFLYEMLMDPFIYGNKYIPYMLSYSYLAYEMQQQGYPSSISGLYQNLQYYAPLTKFQLVYASFQVTQYFFVLVVVYKLNPAPPLSNLPLMQPVLLNE
ncbi:MAG: STT3 domain-containing protein [Thermoprotei archaeon]